MQCMYTHRLVLDSALLIQMKAIPQMRIKLQITYMSMYCDVKLLQFDVMFMLRCLQQFFLVFSDYQKNDFYVTGEV